MKSSFMLKRRDLITAGVSMATVMAMPVLGSAGRRIETPYQTPGPFYPRSKPVETDNDLIQVESQSGRPEGVVTHILGRVTDTRGKAVSGARVEIWQCDAAGFYHHWRDRGGRADPNFQGYGQMQVEADGGFRFRTIKPVAYPGRAPHIHFRITGRGIDGLTTQMYVAGDPRNDGDFVLNTVTDERARASLIVELKPAPELEKDSLAGLFDIVLGDATVFGRG